MATMHLVHSERAGVDGLVERLDYLRSYAPDGVESYHLNTPHRTRYCTRIPELSPLVEELNDLEARIEEWDDVALRAWDIREGRR
ncbi:MAG: hypothetical protein NUW01_14355 [Gemmatimonadaceae bacterium]|nr:hypothetical protein [Gemmatimonadaceae bacterium]